MGGCAAEFPIVAFKHSTKLGNRCAGAGSSLSKKISHFRLLIRAKVIVQQAGNLSHNFIRVFR